MPSKKELKYRRIYAVILYLRNEGYSFSGISLLLNSVPLVTSRGYDWNRNNVGTTYHRYSPGGKIARQTFKKTQCTAENCTREKLPGNRYLCKRHYKGVTNE